jgi:alanine dehydrogenase
VTTLLITRSQVAAWLSLEECIEALEGALLAQAAGRTVPSSVLALHVAGGGLHVKAAGLYAGNGRGYLAAKLNANFPGNPDRHGLPTIQGVIALVDAADGRLLALMDSIEITALRTAAATAVAARRLARPDASLAGIIGCGRQGRAQLQALAAVRRLRRALAFDAVAERAGAFAREMTDRLGFPVEVAASAADAARADMCVTCTTSRRPVIAAADVRPGTFVAAVGADSPEKQELDPMLLARATVVVDHLEQCAAFGELHHALAAGVIGLPQVRAQLHELVAGAHPGRTAADEITVFDSTGTALQDVAAAVRVYEKAADAPTVALDA